MFILSGSGAVGNDQFRLCRERAAQERWEIVGSHEDAAISGSSTILRSGIQRLVCDAQRGEFNILLAERLTASAAIRRTLPPSTSI
ncbi:recombinase family protein [Ochrobactrum vermis]|uniref:Recombinase family protein n=1 Tax=Ochrobactrum vermis TaxID=1827297 RepID=A0ABU8PDA3_9HYPH